jgi:hypothetical protein
MRGLRNHCITHPNGHLIRLHCSTELVHNVKELLVCTKHEMKFCMFIENAPNIYTTHAHVCTAEMCVHTEQGSKTCMHECRARMKTTCAQNRWHKHM